MRLLLFAGKGGAGATTLAAGTAALAGRSGRKTLLVSTSPSRSLAVALGVAGAGSTEEPTEIEPGLCLAALQPRRHLERLWPGVQEEFLSALDATGIDPISREELTLLPGVEEVVALLELRDLVAEGRWDLVVVDLAGIDLVRTMALPETLGRYLRRIYPIERRVARALRPVLGPALGLPSPKHSVFDAVARLQQALSEVATLLSDSQTTLRLVVTAETVALAAAREVLTALSLYDFRPDGVIANRLVPSDGLDPWRDGWGRAQRELVAEFEAAIAPLPVWRASYAAREPVGPDALAAVADTAYGALDPLADRPSDAAPSVARRGDDFVMSLSLPFADREDLELSRIGDEIAVTVGCHRRLLVLPSALRRCSVSAAAFTDGQLNVTFRPDPALWRGVAATSPSTGRRDDQRGDAHPPEQTPASESAS